MEPRVITALFNEGHLVFEHDIVRVFCEIP